MPRMVALALLTGVAIGQRQGRIPDAAALAAAQPEIVRALVDRMTQREGHGVVMATGELLSMAMASESDATRFLLWREAVALAERSGELGLACGIEGSLAGQFGLDPADRAMQLLQRAAHADDPTLAAAAALVALDSARAHTGDADDRAMLGFYDVATRAALQCGHTPTFTYVRDHIATLRSERATIAAFAAAGGTAAELSLGLGIALLRGELAAFDSVELGDLARVLPALDDLPLDRRPNQLTFADWRALAARERDPERHRGLLRCALTAAKSAFTHGDEARRRAACEQIVSLTAQLAQHDGVTRLGFAGERDLPQLAYANGDWRIEQGELRGTARGTDNYATHRLRFSSLRAVVIRGGIRSADGLNFRCKVGDVNLLLNWEVADENHLWLNGVRHPVGPRVLRPGTEHTIAIFTDGALCHVCVDGTPLWTVQLRHMLSGTISVYPALGSEIFVRQILVDGRPDGLVDAPIGVSM